MPIDETTMPERIRDLVRRRLHATAGEITPLGGGFYGRVFLAELIGKPSPVVFKLYLYPNLARAEALQLNTLRSHALFPMPEVYFTDIGEGGVCDALAMEYISGVNAGKLPSVPEESRERLAEEITDNLLAWHEVSHPEGFGDLDAEGFAPDWRGVYRLEVERSIPKAEALRAAGELDGDTLLTMLEAVSRYDDVFREPIRRASLIHGDYNTWNVMLTEDLRHVKAIIDPFRCRWADAEYDLYQLGNANGEQFGLLNAYAKKRALSAEFPAKRAFYELFTELNHFSDARVPIARSNIPAQARVMKSILRNL